MKKNQLTGIIILGIVLQQLFKMKVNLKSKNE
jgi:hypothetical protein